MHFPLKKIQGGKIMFLGKVPHYLGGGEGSMRSLKKKHPMAHTEPHNHGHGNSMTESAQWGRFSENLAENRTDVAENLKKYDSAGLSGLFFPTLLRGWVLFLICKKSSTYFYHTKPC